MGTTESIFADTETEVSSPAPPLPSASTSPSASLRRRRPRNTPSSDPSTISHPQQKQALQQPTKSAPVRRQSFFQLNGIVLGMSKSGKRTLLQRLEGKEPDFLDTAANRQNDDNEAVVVVNAPYQPSLHLPKFNQNETIQLHVQAMKKISSHKHQEKDSNDMNTEKNDDFHFYVILINPRHDRTKVRKYITKRFHDILRLQGYMKNNDTMDAPSPMTASGSGRPFCVSLLRNFCDRIQNIPPESIDSIIQISDLTMWTMEVLGEYPEMMENVRIPPLLQCIDTSLLNCYGLSALHHFIYQSYVQNKQYIVQKELFQIEEAISMSRQEATSFVVPYDEYIENIEPLLQGSAASTSTTIPSSNNSAGSSIALSANRPVDNVTTTAGIGGANGNTNNINRRSIINTQYPSHPNDQNRKTKRQSHPPSSRNDQYPPDPPRSRTMSGETSTSTIPSIQQTLDHAKDALEAFLESDSDDDVEDEEEEKQRLNRTKEHEKDDDDSDGDEDFYLDETIMDEVETIKSSTDTNQNSPIVNPIKTTESLSLVVDVEQDDQKEELRIGRQQETVNDDNTETVPPACTDDKSAEIVISPQLQLNDTAEPSPQETSNAMIEPGVPTKPLSPRAENNIEHDDDDESDFFVEEEATESKVGNMDATNILPSRRIDETDSKHADTVVSVDKHQIQSSVGLSSDEKNHPKAPDNRGTTNNGSNDVAAIAVHNVDTTEESMVPQIPAAVTPKSENDQISDAARAALELARQDFERMLLEQEQAENKVQGEESKRDALPKKSKKDKHRKKSSTKEGKKSKRDDS